MNNFNAKFMVWLTKINFILNIQMDKSSLFDAGIFYLYLKLFVKFKLLFDICDFNDSTSFIKVRYHIGILFFIWIISCLIIRAWVWDIFKQQLFHIIIELIKFLFELLVHFFFIKLRLGFSRGSFTVKAIFIDLVIFLRDHSFFLE